MKMKGVFKKQLIPKLTPMNYLTKTTKLMAVSYQHSSTLITTALILLLPSFHKNLAAAKHTHHHVSSATSRHHNRHHIPSSSSTNISNPRLHQAYIALQAWKKAIHSDPKNFTTNWVGPSVCNYTGVYCAPLPNAATPTITVAGVDLNLADIAGFLPDEIGLLSDLALLHLNTNRFCGVIPNSLSNMSLLFELDLSNNRFVGTFPDVVLCLPTLKYLDLRYNDFEGPLPPQLFAKNFDAIFLNNNRFSSVIPQNLGTKTTSGATVLVFANNDFRGCLPPSIANFADTLEELVFTNTNLSGCLPPEVGFLYKLRLLDLSRNKIVGTIPYSVAGLAHLELLNLGHNMMTGTVPEGICILPKLANFTVSYNFFCEEEGACESLIASKRVAFDDRRNCLPERPLQRRKEECDAVAEHPVDCYNNNQCGGGG